MEQTTATDDDDDDDDKETTSSVSKVHSQSLKTEISLVKRVYEWTMSCCIPQTVIVMDAGQATAVSEEDDEEESHFSEGQVITVSSQSDESEISEELQETQTGVYIDISFIFCNATIFKAIQNILRERDHVGV